MPKKLTQSEWINAARKAHDDLYDYSKVKYINSKTKVLVGCHAHGFWECQPSNHIGGHKTGCPKCGGSNKKTTKQFILDAKKVHGDKYDYSSSNYLNSHKKVTISCRKHGDFAISPTAHLGGQGCKQCGNNYRLRKQRSDSLITVIDRLQKLSDGNVTIDKKSFTNINSIASFKCAKHGKFDKNVNAVIYGEYSCVDCHHESNEYIKDRKSPVYTQLTAEKKIQSLLSENTSCKPFKFDNSDSRINFCCSKHGEWEISFRDALRTNAKCPICRKIIGDEKRRKSIIKSNKSKIASRFEDYLEKFSLQHGDKYDYQYANFINGRSNIEIHCPIHGPFFQTPGSHIKQGCRKCADEELAGLYNEKFFALKPELKNSHALVYCLKLTHKKETFFKFGITVNDLKRRFGMALAKKIDIEVLAICETNLYSAWQYEVQLLNNSKHLKYLVKDKIFARAARISSSELLSKLPNNWKSIIPWTSFPNMKL